MNQKNYLGSFLEEETGMAYFVEHFFFVFHHEGNCGTPQMIQQYLQYVPSRPRLYPCISSVYQRYEQLQKERPMSKLQLTNHELSVWFSREYSDEQRFAILFAKWYGLSEWQIKWIANHRNTKCCWYSLNWFLCHSEGAPIPTDPVQLQLPDGLNYKVWINGICKSAHAKNGALVLDDSEDILEIV